jgi:hypothetical protein
MNIGICERRGLEPLLSKLLAKLITGDRPKRKAAEALRDLAIGALRADKPPPSDGTPCTCDLINGAENASADILVQRLAAGLVKGVPVPRASLNALAKALGDVTPEPEPTRWRMPHPERGDAQYRRTAQHEAGHAVAAVLIGVPVAGAYVGKAAGEGLLGRVDPGAVGRALTPSETLLLYLSGPAAEKWTGSSDFVPRGSDRKEVRKALKHLTGTKPDDDDLARMVRDLAGVFIDPCVAKATERVAGLLAGAVGGKLDGATLERAVRDDLGDHFERTTRMVRSCAQNMLRAYLAQKGDSRVHVA